MRVILVIVVGLCLVGLATPRNNKDENQKGKNTKKDKNKDNEAICNQTVSSDGSINPFPDQITIHCESKLGGNVTFNLRKNQLTVPSEIKLQFASQDETNKKKGENASKFRRIYMYTDGANLAEFSVRIQGSKENGKRYQLEGSYVNNGDLYEMVLSPSDPGNKTRYQITKVHLSLSKPKHIPDDEDWSSLSIFRDKNTTNRTFYREKGSRRKKRSLAHMDYHVNILIVVDHSVYEYWYEREKDESVAEEQITYYFTHVMNGIQNVFKSINPAEHGFTVNPWLSSIFIAKTPQDSPYMEHAIIGDHGNKKLGHANIILDENILLDDIKLWRDKTEIGYNDPDHVMVFTRFDIRDVNVVGYAPMGSICLGYGKGGISVNEDNGLTSWVVAAHELAHNLGSHHDGVDNPCKPEEGFIMAPSSLFLDAATAYNNHRLSPCSIQQIKDLLEGSVDGYPRTCLYEGECSHISGHDGGMDPHDRFTFDEQCEFVLGDGAHQCHIPDTDICQVLWCGPPGEEGCTSFGGLYATQGTPCGKGKECYNQQCVSSDEIPKNSQSHVGCEYKCPGVPQDCEDAKGTIVRLGHDPLTCSNISSTFPELCFRYDFIKEDCPASCQAIMCGDYDEPPCGSEIKEAKQPSNCGPPPPTPNRADQKTPISKSSATGGTGLESKNQGSKQAGEENGDESNISRQRSAKKGGKSSYREAPSNKKSTDRYDMANNSCGETETTISSGSKIKSKNSRKAKGKTQGRRKSKTSKNEKRKHSRKTNNKSQNRNTMNGKMKSQTPNDMNYYTTAAPIPVTSPETSTEVPLSCTDDPEATINGLKCQQFLDPQTNQAVIYYCIKYDFIAEYCCGSCLEPLHHAIHIN